MIKIEMKSKQWDMHLSLIPLSLWFVLFHSGEYTRNAKKRNILQNKNDFSLKLEFKHTLVKKVINLKYIYFISIVQIC